MGFDGWMLQAVLYFQRALKQDRRFLNAWTLMGHEYVEMKNPPAAIGAPLPCRLAALGDQGGNHAALEEAIYQPRTLPQGTAESPGPCLLSLAATSEHVCSILQG